MEITLSLALIHGVGNTISIVTIKAMIQIKYSRFRRRAEHGSYV